MAETMTRKVKNKDIVFLQTVNAMEAEVTSIEHRFQWERERMKKITQNLSAVPSYGSGAYGMDDAFAKIEELATEHSKAIKGYQFLMRKAERILAGIESQQMRTMVRRLYLDGASGKTVRAELKMSRWTFENARQQIEDAGSMKDVQWHDRYVEG